MAVKTRKKQIPTGEGLTFEKVWAALMETRERQEKSALEFDRRMEKSEIEWEKLRKASEKTEKFLNDLGKQMGDLHRSFGNLAEHLVAPGIAQRFNELGYQFYGVAPGGYVIRDKKTGKDITEIDILLENSTCIMAVEVKAKPRIQDIEHHIKRLEILRKYWKPKDSRKLCGAIAGAVFGSAEKKATIDAGFYVIEQSGDTMKINVPKNFKPKVW